MSERELPGKGQPLPPGVWPRFKQGNERTEAAAKARSLSGRTLPDRRQPGPILRGDPAELNSEKHLACIRRLPCLVSIFEQPGEIGNDPHHLKCTGERGIGKKSSDCWTLPLKREHHDSVERAGAHGEIAWFKGRGIADPISIAWKLWQNTGDMGRMRGIVLVTFMYSRPPDSWTDHASFKLAEIGEPWVKPLVEAYDRARSAGALFEK